MATSALKEPPRGPLERGMKLLKRKDRVPEKTPSILRMESPVERRVVRVLRMGRPAPTVDSWKM